MKEVLQERVVPTIRKKGFHGSFPHFRRVKGGKLHLLSFQFDKWGGGFIINLAIGPPEGFTTHWGERISPEKLNCDYDLHPKTRIQPGSGPGTQDWFRFDPISKAICEETANQVIPYLDQAEEWFG